MVAEWGTCKDWSIYLFISSINYLCIHLYAYASIYLSIEDGDYGYDDPEGYEYEEYESDATGEEEQEAEGGFGIAHSKMDPTRRYEC